MSTGRKPRGGVAFLVAVVNDNTPPPARNRPMRAPAIAVLALAAVLLTIHIVARLAQ